MVLTHINTKIILKNDYRKVLRLRAASKLEILCFVFKFKELIPFTPMYYCLDPHRVVY